jgi:hypothetical protein
MRSLLGGLLILSSALSQGAALARATVVTVPAQANIYGSGQTTAPGGGDLPPLVRLAPTDQCLTFPRVTGSLKKLRGSNLCPAADGCITIDYDESEGTHLNDPDGVGAYPARSSNAGYKSVSGIIAPFAGYLVGVFVGKRGPSGPAPAPLDFTTGPGTGFTTLAPALDQVFFIGDGLTGDGTGTVQTFTVPTGAAALYFGLSDAGGFNGPPGAYFDNEGAFTVEVQSSMALCPTELRSATLERPMVGRVSTDEPVLTRAASIARHAPDRAVGGRIGDVEAYVAQAAVFRRQERR